MDDDDVTQAELVESDPPPRRARGATVGQDTPEHEAFFGGYVEAVGAADRGLAQPTVLPLGEWLTYREPTTFKPHPAMVTGTVSNAVMWTCVFMADHLTFKKCVIANDATHGQYLRDA